jgi:hypothetical protein
VLNDPDRLQLLKSNGKVLWERRAAGVTDYSIAASELGRYVAVGSQRPNDQVHVALIDSHNVTAWTAGFPGREPRVRLNAAGDAIILSYKRKVEHNADSRFERRLTYLVKEAAGVWTKGGPFTAPYYVSVDRNGGWVVVLDTQQQRPGGDQLPRFRLYGRGGEKRWVYTCPSNILIATASAEGRHIATYRSDGILECMRVIPH